ncbi:MAG: starch-binding protein [Paludibacteraceae bacterium]|nr:starch-binding protein [Paludibacteraceae bacterium]
MKKITFLFVAMFAMAVSVNAAVVRAYPPSDWTETVMSIWIWNTGDDAQDNQFIEMAPMGEYFEATLDFASANLIFVNGSTWNGDANQTVNLENVDLSADVCFQIQEGTGKRDALLIECDGGILPPPVDPINQIKITFRVPEDWDVVNLYAWDEEGNALCGAWPGMQLAIKDGWVAYGFEDWRTFVNIIFNNGAGVQTIDWGADDAQCLELGEADANGKFGLNIISECPEVSTALPEIFNNVKKVEKVVIDGQLYIVLPDGRKFNALGSEVK